MAIPDYLGFPLARLVNLIKECLKYVEFPEYVGDDVWNGWNLSKW